MSVTSRLPIVSAVITLLILPLLHGQKAATSKTVRGQVHHLRCVKGTNIESSPLARRLGVVGRPCAEVIVRHVKTPNIPKAYKIKTFGP